MTAAVRPEPFDRAQARLRQAGRVSTTVRPEPFDHAQARLCQAGRVSTTVRPEPFDRAQARLCQAGQVSTTVRPEPFDRAQAGLRLAGQVSTTVRPERSREAAESKGLVWIAFLALLIPACVTAPVPEKHYYRMSIDPPKSQTGKLRAPTLVVVEPARAPAVYGERGIVYSDDPQHISLRHYPYDFWVDPPPRLVQQELIRYLQAANPTAAFAAEAGRRQPDYTISADLERFERLKTGQGWKVAVSMRLRVEQGSTSAPLMTRDYARQLDAADNTIEATVQAFSVATTDILRQFSADLDQALPANTPMAGK